MLDKLSALCNKVCAAEKASFRTLTEVQQEAENIENKIDETLKRKVSADGGITGNYLN